MAARQRRAWCPQRLRERRQRQQLTLEQAAEELRRLACDQGGVEPGATAQTVWRHERGQYPGKLYRRLYCQLYQATEVELGFRPPLPAERAFAAESDEARHVRHDDLVLTATVLGYGFPSVPGRRYGHSPPGWAHPWWTSWST